MTGELANRAGPVTLGSVMTGRSSSVPLGSRYLGAPLDVEAHSRLSSILSVIENEIVGLEALDDERLFDAIRALNMARSEIVAALASLEQPPRNGR
jgi:hypothetical protein